MDHATPFFRCKMNFSKLSREKKELCEKIRRKEVDEKYSELDLDYVREFVTENGISSDFKLFSLLDENGLPSGLGKCSACEDKFQV